MKTAQKIVSNLVNENIFSLNMLKLIIRQDGWYLGITYLYQNTDFTLQNP